MVLSPSTIHQAYMEFYNSFWLQPQVLEAAQHSSMGRTILRSQIQQAITNFIRIITGQSIPVRYRAEDENYTDGDTITIKSLEQLTPTDIDIVVGIALHEASHIILSKKGNHLESTPLFLALSDLVSQFPDSYDLMHLILNYLEDRRIDAWMYRNAVGYRGYYDAMYDRYWLHPDIGTKLKHPKTHTQTVENYLFHLINMQNEAADPSFLPGLDRIWKLVNLDEIVRFDKSWPGSWTVVRGDQATPEIIQTAWEIYDVIMENTDEPPYRQPRYSTVGTQFDDQRKFLNHDLKGEIVFDDEASMLAAMENSSITVNSSTSIKTLFFPNVTLTHTSILPFLARQRYTPSQDALSRGVILGTRLAQKLKVMGEDGRLIYNRQRNGEIDDHLLADLSLGEERVFSRIHLDHTSPIHVHLSLDASTSMTKDDKWENALTLTVAIVKAATLIEPLSVEVSIRSSMEDVAYVGVVFDSRRDGFSKVSKLFPFLKPRGETPEGAAFEGMLPHLFTKASDRKLFVNLSDGMPFVINKSMPIYGGESALNHTARQIRRIEATGVQILSYFLTGKTVNPAVREGFSLMYGRGATFINPTDVTEIARTLNRIFTERC